MARQSVAGVILAAGRGERMRTGRPKVLHPVAGLPMAAHVVRAFRAAGVRRIVVVVSKGGDAVEEALAAPGVRFAVQARQRGTADALLAARRSLAGFRGDLLVACGDAPLLTGEALRAFLASHRASGAAHTVGAFEAADPSGYGRVLEGSDGVVGAIVEEREASPAQRAVRLVNGGVYVFSAPAIWALAARVSPSAVKRELYLTDVVRLAGERGDVVRAWRAGDPEAFRGVNTLADLAAAERILRERIRVRLMASGVEIRSPETVLVDADVVVGPGTVLHPFTVLERGVRVGAGCQVGPFARLRGRTTLADGAEIGNFVEVKASRIGPRAKAKHLAYLGDGVIGAGANIGAGTILANYDGRRKWPTAIGPGAFIGSGAVLVAPVRVGAKALVGAGAVVTRGRNVPPRGVVAGVPARPLRRRR